MRASSLAFFQSTALRFGLSPQNLFSFIRLVVVVAGPLFEEFKIRLLFELLEQFVMNDRAPSNDNALEGSHA